MSLCWLCERQAAPIQKEVARDSMYPLHSALVEAELGMCRPCQKGSYAPCDPHDYRVPVGLTLCLVCPFEWLPMGYVFKSVTPNVGGLEMLFELGCQAYWGPLGPLTICKASANYLFTKLRT